ETTAVASLHRIDTAQVAYAATYNDGYAKALADLGPPVGPKAGPTGAGLLENDLGCRFQPCVRSGYAFAIQRAETAPTPNYHAIGLPVHPGLSGGRCFFTDTSH